MQGAAAPTFSIFVFRSNVQDELEDCVLLQYVYSSPRVATCKVQERCSQEEEEAFLFPIINFTQDFTGTVPVQYL